MPKFRKKPVVIEAIKFQNGIQPNELSKDVISGRIRYTEEGTVLIHTLEGIMEAKSGDWIIRGVKGELYPCKPDIFEATYEAADTPTNVGEQCRRPTEEQLIQLIKKHTTSMNGAERIWHWNLEQAISDTARAVLALTAPPGDGCCTRSDFHLPLTLKPLADPNHDPGDRVVIDGQGAHIGTISNTELAETAVAAINGLCEDCPPTDYPTDETRCEPCLRRSHAAGE